MKPTRVLFIGVFLCFCLTASGQDLISFSSNGQLYPAIAKQRYEKEFKDIEKPEIQPEEVKLFKTVYRARMPHGGSAQLSGLVAIPASGAPKGLVLFFHGTTSDRENVPSRYRGNNSPEEINLAIVAFATAGYAVAAPDYLGLGDHNGVHPFPLGSVNCWSGIDLITPAREISAKVGLPIGKDLFVTGFSEGGAAAMWAVRRMEALPEQEYRVTRAAPLSGPYSLSDVQAKSMISRQSNAKWLAARVFFAAYAGYGIQRYLPEIDLGAYFSPSFATYIPFVFNQRLNDRQTIEKFAKKALQMGALVDLNRLLKLEFRDALKARDVSDPFVSMLVANDCHDWTPRTPMYLFCISDDFLVPKENAIAAITAMRARGVGKEVVAYYCLEGRKYDHMTGALPGLIYARKFFDGGFEGVPVSDDP